MKSRNSGGRRDFEAMKRSKIGISEDPQFADEEIEVAGIITCFRHYWRLFLRWGSKRKRSAFQRDENSATDNSILSPLDISVSENHYELENGGMAMASPPPPVRRLQPTSCPNSRNVRGKNRPRKRVTKKKTHKELTETLVELSLENARLIKEVEQMRKTSQDLKDCNVIMESQLALGFEQRQQQNMPYTSWSSSSGLDTRQKTEIVASCGDFQRCDEHEHFEKCSGSSDLVSAYDKLQRLGRTVYPCSSEASFGSQKDGAIPTKDTVCSGYLDLNTPNESLFGANSGFLDLNTPNESLFGTNISDDLHDQMSMSESKAAAAETRRQMIELERDKFPQLRWTVLV